MGDWAVPESSAAAGGLRRFVRQNRLRLPSADYDQIDGTNAPSDLQNLADTDHEILRFCESGT